MHRVQTCKSISQLTKACESSMQAQIGLLKDSMDVQKSDAAWIELNY